MSTATPISSAQQGAVCCLRVIEIPTPRWTAYEAERYGVQMPEEVPVIAIE